MSSAGAAAFYLALFHFQQAAEKALKAYVPTRYPNGLPGGVPSRYYDDPEEAAEAAELARQVVELAAAKSGFAVWKPPSMGRRRRAGELRSSRPFRPSAAWPR